MTELEEDNELEYLRILGEWGPDEWRTFVCLYRKGVIDKEFLEGLCGKYSHSRSPDLSSSPGPECSKN